MNEANFISLDLIEIGERTRQLDTAHRDSLVANIKERKRLLQPIVLHGTNKLLAGLHRTSAMRLLHEESFPAFFGDELIPPGCIPFVHISELSAEEILSLELTENLFRKDLSWPERTQALARLHAMEKARSGSDGSILQTAKKLVADTGRNVDATRNAISRAVIVADAIKTNPELANARSETEAFTRIKSDIARVSHSLLSHSIAATASAHVLREGDCRDVLSAMGDPAFDLVLVDPPYGVGADTWTSKFKGAPHDYKDTWTHAREISSDILYEAFRLTRPSGSIFMFCAVERWHELRDIAEEAGWSTWPRPVIWHKSNEGIAPWGIKGFTYCYEALLFATKTKGLIRTAPDVISGIYKVRDREHGAAKPPALYKHLIDLCCLPGDHILDPCCGSGTIFEAATLTKTIATGIELNPHFIGLCRQRLAELAATPSDPEQTLIDFDI